MQGKYQEQNSALLGLPLGDFGPDEIAEEPYSGGGLADGATTIDLVIFLVAEAK